MAECLKEKYGINYEPILELKIKTSVNNITGDKIQTKFSNTYGDNLGDLTKCANCDYKSHYKDKFVLLSGTNYCNNCYKNFLLAITCKTCGE